MGFIDRLLGRRHREPDVPPVLPEVGARRGGDGGPDRAGVVPEESDAGWSVPPGSVPPGGDGGPVLGPGGVPVVHLVPDRDPGGAAVLRLCADPTGVPVGVSDRRLPGAGIYVSRLRGQAYHRIGCTDGDLHPGARVRLVREPDNEFDPDAVAVYDGSGRHLAGYLDNQKARLLSRLIDSGAPIEAISIRGTGPGRPCDQVVVLAAAPDVLRRLLEARPAGLPPPARES